MERVSDVQLIAEVSDMVRSAGRSPGPPASAVVSRGKTIWRMVSETTGLAVPIARW